MDYPKVDTQKRGNGQDKKTNVYSGGILTSVEDEGLAKEFITVGKTLEESMGRTVFIDDRQLNSVIALYRKLVKFHNIEGLKHLKMFLDGRPAIGGYNRSQALMSGAQIVVGEALGVKLGKDSMKFIEKQVMAKNSNPNNNNDGKLNE